MSGPLGPNCPMWPVTVLLRTIVPVMPPPAFQASTMMPQPPVLLVSWLPLIVLLVDATGEPGPGLGVPGSTGPLSARPIPPLAFPLIVLLVIMALVTPSSMTAWPSGISLFGFTVLLSIGLR